MVNETRKKWTLDRRESSSDVLSFGIERENCRLVLGERAWVGFVFVALSFRGLRLRSIK